MRKQDDNLENDIMRVECQEAALERDHVEWRGKKHEDLVGTIAPWVDQTSWGYR